MTLFGHSFVSHLKSDEYFEQVISSNPEHIFIQIGGNDIVPSSTIPIMQQAKVVCQDIIDIVNKLKSSSIKHIFVGKVFFSGRNPDSFCKVIIIRLGIALIEP